MLGFDAENSLFAENSWYFRNALVRANYNDIKNGIGVMYYKGENKRYEGNYINDKKNGFGIFFEINSEDKIIEKGIFKDNELIKKI